MAKKDTQFKSGKEWTGNANGRPVGSRSFKTLFIEAVKKVAEDTGQDPAELERDIVAKGLLEARKGDYRFYKDLLDRVHGKAETKIDHTTKGEKINFTWGNDNDTDTIHTEKLD